MRQNYCTMHHCMHINHVWLKLTNDFAFNCVVPKCDTFVYLPVTGTRIPVAALDVLELITVSLHEREVAN